MASERECAHSSNWWKEMQSCWACGAMYSDEEAERIRNEYDKRHPVFTAEQQRIIDANESEDDNGE